ncbi:MAG: gluconate 2-dehydrogenase subunit 3 family protein [Henriciella sp.]|nr:gluconate 2-dehydrogenase subunit 3 family protein [Henriciella sp.]
MRDFKLHRRQVFQGLIALSAVGGIAACSEQTNSSSDATADSAISSGLFDAADMALIAALSETLIPRTDTAGAIDAEVPDTLQALATDWGDEGFQSYWLTGLANLRTVLNERAGARFETLEHSQRGEVLSAYDRAVFDGDIEDGFYRDFKNTVIQAFYMSEPGATEALAYEPVPGEWIGCVPLSDYPKNWAT